MAKEERMMSNKAMIKALFAEYEPLNLAVKHRMKLVVTMGNTLKPDLGAIRKHRSIKGVARFYVKRRKDKTIFVWIVSSALLK